MVTAGLLTFKEIAFEFVHWIDVVHDGCIKRSKYINQLNECCLLLGGSALCNCVLQAKIDVTFQITILIEYKPTKFTFSKLISQILIFYFNMFLTQGLFFFRKTVVYRVMLRYVVHSAI
jgi:hypothetical protein